MQLSKSIFLAVLLLCAWTRTTAQQADADYANHGYQAAIRKYEAQVAQHPEDGELLFNLANSYRLNGEMVKAENWFARTVEHSDKANAQLYYAQVLLSNGRYAMAKTWFEKYAGIASKESDAANARALALQCQQLENSGIHMNKYSIARMPFNSEKLDFSPRIWKPGYLVFASNRAGATGKKAEKDPWTEDNFVDLYVVEHSADGRYETPRRLNKSLNSNYHEGPVSFTEPGDVMYFTRSDYVKRRRGFDDRKNTQLKIYRAEWLIDQWEMGEALSFNDRMFSSCHPALSPDGQSMVFASDRPGGYGGMDLYLARKEATGWGSPTNLGPEINTAGNEVFPFVHQNGDLYFSSDLQVGIGGLDIFSCRPKGESWTGPENIGAPINSPRDDFGLIMNEDRAGGYFTSNRNGQDDDIYSFVNLQNMMVRARVVDCGTQAPISGVAVMKTGSAEGVYVSDANGWIEFPAEAGDRYDLQATGEDYFLTANCDGKGSLKVPGEGIILLPVTKDCPTNDCPPLPATPVMLTGTALDAMLNTPLPETTLEVVNKCTGKSRNITTDKDGKYQVLLPENPDCDYWLLAKKPGYSPRNIPLNIKGRTLNSPEEMNVPLDPIDFVSRDGDRPLILPNPFDRPFPLDDSANSDPRTTTLNAGMVIELHNIYFDYDKYFIRGDAISDLQYVQELMHKYPNMRGEIAAHTDSRATFDYNITLSNNRANAAKTWLIQRGVAPERLTARGYGETQLRNECADGVECTEKQHQRNRRVEFRVTYFDGVVNSKEYEYFKERRSRP